MFFTYINRVQRTFDLKIVASFFSKGEKYKLLQLENETVMSFADHLV